MVLYEGEVEGDGVEERGELEGKEEEEKGDVAGRGDDEPPAMVASPAPPPARGGGRGGRTLPAFGCSATCVKRGGCTKPTKN